MILDEIVATTTRDLAVRKKNLPLEKLKELAREQPAPLDFASALRGDGVRLIAEVKKASPSRGVIRADFHPVEIAAIYARNGASAISVLTESEHFQGSLDYLKVIRDTVEPRIPLLRKDFIFDPYQVWEARAYGADCLLLIAAILIPAKLWELLELSHQLGMKCLVEVHNESELDNALKSGAGIIGINNRDLKTFAVNLDTTGRLRSLIPSDRIVVSESGIKNRADMAKMRDWQIDAVLIGEALVSVPDIAAGMKEFL
jgi:indole-3-glycerol phosphate synthase